MLSNKQPKGLYGERETGNLIDKPFKTFTGNSLGVIIALKIKIALLFPKIYNFMKLCQKNGVES